MMPLKIFYLDDEPDLLEMFVELFESPHREIRISSDPNRAIEAIRSSPPDILFLDYRLPNTTGDKIALQLDPAIPKILITGDMHLKCEYPFVAIFEKPYSPKAVREILNEYEKRIKAA